MSSNEIFIVDDDEEMRDVLSIVFARAGYLTTTFADGISLLRASLARTPACVLLDICMPDPSGLDILKELVARNYAAPILIVSGQGDIPIAVEAIRNGAFDFVEKRLNAEMIVARVHDAIDAWARDRQSGNTFSFQKRSSSFPGYGMLTCREREVLSQITAAASNKEAARTLGISPRTVEVHRARIMQKLSAKNSVDLVRIVLNHGPSM